MSDVNKAGRVVMLALAAGVASTVSGCATIISGGTQDIAVSTQPAPDARCELNNDKGDVTVASTPGSALVHRSGEPLVITCEKNGVKTSRTVYADVNGWVFGNILFGGLIGLGVDYITGALHKYPDNVQVSVDKS